MSDTPQTPAILPDENERLTTRDAARYLGYSTRRFTELAEKYNLESQIVSPWKGFGRPPKLYLRSEVEQIPRRRLREDPALTLSPRVVSPSLETVLEELLHAKREAYRAYNYADKAIKALKLYAQSRRP